MTMITCNDDINNIPFNDPTSIILTEQQQVVNCTFENMRNMGTIKIIKNASGGPDTPFDFDVVGTDSFSEILTAGDQNSMDMTGPISVRTGVGYQIWETIPADWMHMGVNCNVPFVEDTSGRFRR